MQYHHPIAIYIYLLKYILRELLTTYYYTNYDQIKLRDYLNDNEKKNDQKKAYDNIINSLDNKEKKVFFMCTRWNW